MPGVPSNPSPSASAWRCAACRTLLGLADGDRVEIRYKTAAYTIQVLQGATEITASCRRCGAPAALSLAPEAEPGPGPLLE